MFRHQENQRFVRQVVVFGAVLTFVAMANVALASPLTQTFNVATGGPDSISGTISGSLKAQATSGSINANFTDVDIDTNILDFSNRTGLVTLAANTATSVINLNLNSTPYSSALTGSLSATADDSATDVAPGTFGWLTAGTDGRWDDPTNTGSFVNASYSGTSLVGGNINISAASSGGIFGTGSGGINLANIPLLGTLWMQVLNTSNFSVTMAPTQSVSVNGLSLTTSGSFPVSGVLSNFVEASHPVGSFVTDMSISGGGLVATTVSGTLSATLVGTISADLDLRVKIGGTATSGGTTLATLNNAFVGDLATNTNLFTVAQAVSFNQSLPFAFTILHEPTVNVDYDDVIVKLQTGTFGATFPLPISTTTSVTVPTTPFAAQNLSGGGGGITLNDLDLVGNLTGSVAANLTGTINLSADLLAQAIKTNAANIQPLNTGPTAASATSTNNPNYSNTFAGVFNDADLAANQFISSYETLMFEFDTSPATLASQIGDGFMTGSTTPIQFTAGLLNGTLSLTQLLAIFGNLGTYTAYANVKDAAGLVHSIPFQVNVVPEPSSLLVWTGLIGAVAVWQRRRRGGRRLAA